jgi:prepilin-type N-terminal cleavage/methylation domain-containing protein
MFTRHNRGGFTLIEVIVAVSVLVVVSTTVFIILRAALESAVAVEETQTEFQRQQTLRRVLDRMFRELPPNVRLSALPPDGQTGADWVDLAPYDPLEPWRPVRDPLKEARLAVMEQANGLLTFGVRLRDADSRGVTAARPEGEEFFPLMRDLRSVRWRFFSPGLREWMPSWTSGGERPALVEMVWQPGDGSDPVRWVFRVSRIQAGGES